MKIAVGGSRRRRDMMFIFARLDDFARKGDVIISGGAPGVDRLARGYAWKRGLKFKEHLPENDTAAARRRRNRRIVGEADVLLAFPGTSKKDGTWHAVRLARKARKRTAVWEVGK